MRILAMSDLHGNLDVYHNISKLIELHQPEVLVLAGDLLDGGKNDDLSVEEEQTEEARRIIEILKALQMPVLYIMGNDDFVDLGYDDDLIQYIHARKVIVQGYSFVGYQYSLPWMNGVFEKPEGDIAIDLMTIERLLDERSILVTHSPAYGILDEARFIGEIRHVGSRGILELVQRYAVLAHIHGHVHEGFGRKENHFNVAAGRRMRGMVIDLPQLACVTFGE